MVILLLAIIINKHSHPWVLLESCQASLPAPYYGCLIISIEEWRLFLECKWVTRSQDIKACLPLVAPLCLLSQPHSIICSNDQQYGTPQAADQISFLEKPFNGRVF